MIFNYYRPRTVRGLINRDRSNARAHARWPARRRRSVCETGRRYARNGRVIAGGPRARRSSRLEFSRVSFYNGPSIIIKNGRRVYI